MHGNATLRPVWHTFRVDASFDKQRGITGIGLILRATNKPGRDAAVLARFSEAYIGLPVQAGEQFAVLRALEIASERGYRLLRVRSDYNQMRIALKGDYEAGVVLDEHDLRVMILRVAQKFDQIRVQCGRVFERYTEKARRVIFFGRYEASQFGSPYIETEHLLLGLLREDKALTNRFISPHTSVESIRKQIEDHTTIREKVSTSIDLPLSNECKRVLAYAAEEAERLSHKHIGTEHLLLGLLREEKCFAAKILHERGLQVSTIREELGSAVPVEPEPQQGWVQNAGRDYLTGGAVQLAFFVVVVLTLAKSAISERHLLVIAAVWFAAALVWLRVGARFSFLGKGRERRLVITATVFGLFYHLLMIGWVIPLSIALFRALER